MKSEILESPIEEIYRIRHKVSAMFDHDPDNLHKAMVARQRELAREGLVFWGFNAAGELAPLSESASCATLLARREKPVVK